MRYRCFADRTGVEERRQLHVHVVQDQAVRWPRMDEIVDIQVSAGQQADEEHVQVRSVVQQRGDVLREIVHGIDGIPGQHGARCGFSGYFAVFFFCRPRNSHYINIIPAL